MPGERLFVALVTCILLSGALALCLVPLGQPFGAGLVWLAYRWRRFCKKS